MIGLMEKTGPFGPVFFLLSQAQIAYFKLGSKPPLFSVEWDC